ncbi:small t antigen [Sheep polyomavirus 1]|uniref:small t antigen n=1 Tax=Sheep polyomavirus 1 TaxID=1634381 RepID=UPI00061DED1D|nr:small t antigen [Sheep polyomavirus 1]AKC98335.1 small t antigen [Sheep polyomavirus 1]
MDRALNREEARELMKLLELDMSLYGNLPVMRRAFLAKCKELHPDKGGDGNQMKRLNVLYRTMEANIKESQEEEFWNYSWSPQEVGEVDAIYIKDWTLCSHYRVASCPCLMCQLHRSHLRNKGNVCWRPNVWLRCYCYDCFLTWFGLPREYSTAQLWVSILADTPFRNLNL